MFICILFFRRKFINFLFFVVFNYNCLKNDFGFNLLSKKFWSYIWFDICKVLVYDIRIGKLSFIIIIWYIISSYRMVLFIIDIVF